jgi:nucleoid-associated protein YgaU
MSLAKRVLVLFRVRPGSVCAAVFACIGFCLIPTHAQDVPEASVRATTRASAQQSPAKHVYTEDDLKRPVILTPEDQARIAARRRIENSAPVEQNALQTPRKEDSDSETLGDIAKRYRQGKTARQSEMAAQKRFRPFSFALPHILLATPGPGVAPIAPPISEPAAGGKAKLPLDPALKPNPPVPALPSRTKLSPFQPRPLVANPLAPIAVPNSSLVRQVTHPRLSPGTGVPVAPGGQMERVVVQPGQTWWSLAKLYLGEGTRWSELQKWNEMAGSPESLEAGAIVLVPGTTAADASSQHTVEVHKGDSLWSLAEKYLGQGTAWTCLAQANSSLIDYDHLPVGTFLRLPADNDGRHCSIAVSVRR